MNLPLEILTALMLTAILTVYLFVALLAPEKF